MRSRQRKTFVNAKSMDPFMLKCYEVAVLGEHDKGDGGVVYAEGTSIEYCLLGDLKLIKLPTEFRDRVTELVEESRAEFFVLLQKQDLHLHVSKLKRIGKVPPAP